MGGQPGGGGGAQPEHHEAGRRIGDQLVVGEAPLRSQRQHHGGDDQDEEVVEEVPEIQEQEVQSVAHRLLARSGRSGEGSTLPLSALSVLLAQDRRYRKPASSEARRVGNKCVKRCESRWWPE